MLIIFCSFALYFYHTLYAQLAKSSRSTHLYPLAYLKQTKDISSGRWRSCRVDCNSACSSFWMLCCNYLWKSKRREIVSCWCRASCWLCCWGGVETSFIYFFPVISSDISIVTDCCWSFLFEKRNHERENNNTWHTGLSKTENKMLEKEIK